MTTCEPITDTTFDFENIAKQLYRITKQGGVVVWVVGDSSKERGSQSNIVSARFIFPRDRFSDARCYDLSEEGTRLSMRNVMPIQIAYEFMFVLSKRKTSKLSIHLKTADNKTRCGHCLTSNKKPDGTFKKVMKARKQRKGAYQYLVLCCWISAAQNKRQDCF